MTGQRDNNDAPNPPADVIRDSNLKATIWRNEGEDGPFYATTFARSYKDRDGEYRDTGSFVGTDLLKLSELARAAYNRTNDLRREEREQAPENERQNDPERDARRAAFNERRGGNAERPRISNRER